jgi:hypothetical protein
MEEAPLCRHSLSISSVFTFRQSDRNAASMCCEKRERERNLGRSEGEGEVEVDKLLKMGNILCRWVGGTRKGSTSGINSIYPPPATVPSRSYLTGGY